MSNKREKIDLGPVRELPGPDEDGLIREVGFSPSDIEVVDEALVTYIRNLNLSTRTSEGYRKIPVVWSDSERAYQVKHDERVRDVSGSIIYPLISIERTEISKDPNRKGSAYGAPPEVVGEKGGVVAIARRIVPERSGKFVNAQAKRTKNNFNFAFRSQKPKESKVIYETILAPLPVYFSVMYKINARTEFEQQMNDILQFFIANPGGINYVVLPTKHGHRYEAFIQQNFPRVGNTSNPGSEERLFETTIEIEVLGYVLGEGTNRDRPNRPKYENFVDVRTPRSNAVFDENTAKVYQKDDFGERE